MNDEIIIPKRLHPSQKSAEEAITEYRRKGGKEQFYLYDLVSQKTGDAITLLNEAGKHIYSLPCSIVDKFNQQPGTYHLNEEVDICNAELDNGYSSIRLSKLEFIIETEAKMLLHIIAFRIPPFAVAFPGRKRLPMIPRIGDLGLPDNFCLDR